MIPWRIDADGQLWVMLIRRRRKRRWGIPKGMIDPGQTAEQTATQEALEEAGIAGDLSPRPVGTFEYTKLVGRCLVQVYLLHVTREEARYDEEAFRERRWFRHADALSRKTRRGIHPLLADLPHLIRDSGQND